MRGTSGTPVRLRYTKRGKIRWISHRDVARAMERSFRVTALPLAFSEGFSPRPRVSFGLALSTGHESEAEYLDLVLAAPVDLDELAARLSEALPEGLDVTGVAELADRAPALQEAVTSVEWRLDVARADGGAVDAGTLRVAVDALLARPVVEITKHRKGREVTEDIRPVLRRVDVRDDGPGIDLELATQPRSAKPGEVLAAMGGDIVEVRAVRVHQWIERDGARREPLDADTRLRVPEARAS